MLDKRTTHSQSHPYQVEMDPDSFIKVLLNTILILWFGV